MDSAKREKLTEKGIKITELIGQGRFAYVYSCVVTPSNGPKRIVALKCSIDTLEAIQQLKHEKEILAQLGTIPRADQFVVLLLHIETRPLNCLATQVYISDLFDRWDNPELNMGTKE